MRAGITTMLFSEEIIFVVIAAIIIVVINKEMFFETQHVGNLLEEKIMNREIN